MNTPSTCHMVSEHHCQQKEPGVPVKIGYPRLGAQMAHEESEKSCSTRKKGSHRLEGLFEMSSKPTVKTKQLAPQKDLKYVKISEFIVILKGKKTIIFSSLSQGSHSLFCNHKYRIWSSIWSIFPEQISFHGNKLIDKESCSL